MEIYAHRGYLANGNNEFLENTVEAFENSFSKFDGFEFDVRLSKDRKPMVIHDKNLRRTHGLDDTIHLTHSEKLIQIGLPTLEDILLLAKHNHKKCIVDIKVKANTDKIVDFILYYTKKHALHLNHIICIAYTDEHLFPKGVLFWRGYRLQIPKIIDTRNYGMAVQFTGTEKGMKSIQYTLLNYSCHVNIYIRKIPNKMVWNYLKEIKHAYWDRISITMDAPIYKVLRQRNMI